MSGVMNCTGDPNGSPYKVGFAITDILAGLHLQNGILNAVIHRERTGEGQHVKTSLLESSLFSQCYVPSSWLNGNIDY